MAIWTCNLDVWGNEVEFQVELPDEYTEQDVYDSIYADMWLDLTKED